ncbi:MAG: hypothetical protein RIE31_10180 [Alphaproteobacteria bacterium]
MSVPTFYEIAIFRDGRWSSHATYAERHEAIDDARRIINEGRCESVRVTHEKFDVASSLFRGSTVFRQSRKSPGETAAARRDNMISDSTQAGHTIRILNPPPRRRMGTLWWLFALAVLGAIGMVVMTQTRNWLQLLFAMWS